MGANATNYQCPACTGPLHFDGTTGKLVCDYCDSSFSVEEIEALYAGQEQQSAAAAMQAEDEAAENGAYEEYPEPESMDVRVYSCPTCGAELIADETTIASSCPYCGNPNVTPGPFIHARKPDYVIPFKCTREQAIAALKNHYKGKRLLPNTFADNNHIEEIKGVYVPFWLYGGTADGDIAYHTTRTHTHRQGDWEITRTEHYRVLRSGSVAFEMVPVDGSKKMPDDHMDAIEPFDYSDLKPFSTAYLPGYLADKYDEDEDQCAERAENRFAESIEHCLRNTVKGYGTVSEVSKELHTHRRKAAYALMPVWMLSTSWNGKQFLFAMNGQTGKLIGDLPVDKKKYWTWFGSVAAGVAALLSIVMFVL